MFLMNKSTDIFHKFVSFFSTYFSVIFLVNTAMGFLGFLKLFRVWKFCGKKVIKAELDINEDSVLDLTCNEEDCAVSNEGEEEKEDRLSDLPDCILLHIMSFITTKEVLKTCVLSKRWRFLWTGISNIDLRGFSYYNDAPRMRRYVDTVDRMLMCSGVHLNKFAVYFDYNPSYASNVNLWFDYAVRYKVKDITLQSAQSAYILPHMLFSCSSLTRLSLHRCDIAPLGAVDWPSLKSFSLSEIKLLDCVMEKILKGCPVLEFLSLRLCSGLHRLNICSSSIVTLDILYWIGHFSVFEITIPYVQDLTLIHITTLAQFCFRDVSSLVRAYLDINYNGSVRYMKELLESLQSTKNLELGNGCIMNFALNFGFFEAIDLDFSMVKSLTLTSWSNKAAIHGILGFLKCFPVLESLFIEGQSSGTELSGTWDLLENDDLDSIAPCLKTVKITNFIERDLSAEPLFTLVRILLERAKVLEEIVINVENLVIPN